MRRQKECLLSGSFMVLALTMLFSLLIFHPRRLIASNVDGLQAGPVYTVNTGDDIDTGACTVSHCSLREAIRAANTHPNGATPDKIVFDLPRGTVIKPTRLLPAISDPVILDGTTVGGSHDPSKPAVGMVELDGKKAGSGDGLVFNTNGSILRGFIVYSFQKNGVVLRGDNNVVESCYIGTRGTDDVGNGAAGVFVDDGSNNRIGGETAWSANLISGNGGPGVLVKGGTGNIVAGNFIGVDAFGARALPNAIGVKLHNAAQVTVGGTSSGARNLISGNIGAGIFVDAGHQNQIYGNVIGLDLNQTRALGNGEGILVRNAQRTDIGIYLDSVQGVGNTIAGNGGNGVHVVDSNETDIYQNTIGTSVAGGRVGNGANGVLAEGNNTLTVVEFNEIAYNHDAGVAIRGPMLWVF